MAQGLRFIDAKKLVVTPYGAPNTSGVGSNWRFLSNISLYLRNGAR